ncbi:uncharacterized protein [Coffea arabica]|uniref:Uncharacterized protein n=1 Tax=Coffea arabica TaxID=13443 RepID=A0A6P6SDE6_COFAR|nr:uncharacterized protein LOC113690457 [Coffea arabica]
MAFPVSPDSSFFYRSRMKDQEIPCGLAARTSVSAGMEVIDDSSCDSSTCKHQEMAEEEPGDLLDKSWFFGNLLDRKTTRMCRWYSDPCPSSGLADEEILVGKSYEETFSSLNKLPQGDELTPSGLMRAPSLPEGSTYHAGGGTYPVRRGSKSRLEKSSNNLFRAPSLPTSLGREETQDEESDFSMSKLIRQASLNQSDLLPPRRVPIPKGLTQSSSTPRLRPRRKPDSESCKTEIPEGVMIRRQHPLNQAKLSRSSSDLIVELQGLKDLSIKFDDKDLGPSLQEKKQQQFCLNEGKLRKSYTADQAWQPENPASPMGKKSAEDMKAQIRFWARAVASNVRQEC